MKTNKGFTLVELLVVIAIITILAGMVLPALDAALEAARQIECINNQKQLTLGVLGFANDMDGHMPGNADDYGNANPMKRDWLRGSTYYVDDPLHAPEEGTLFKYVEDKGVYLCPNVTAGELFDPDPERGNGMFDYSMFQSFSGASINKLPRHIRYVVSSGVYLDNFIRPLFVEELPRQALNRSIEGGVASSDSMAPRHSQNFLVANIDGSVISTQINAFPEYAANRMHAISSKGIWYSLGDMGIRWGTWNKR